MSKYTGGSQLKLLFTNVCSLRNKIDELHHAADAIDIIGVAETWTGPNDQIPFHGYNTLRVDRVNHAGGGCALFIRNHIPFTQRYDITSTDNIQVVECDVHVRTAVRIICLYRSPNTTTEEDRSLLNAISHTLKGLRWWVLMGDFNAPAIDWKTGLPLNSNSFETGLVRTIHELAAHQHVQQFTRFRERCRPSLLDLMITQYESDLNEVEVRSPIGKSDHATIYANYSLLSNRPPPKWIRLYSRADRAAIASHARNIDWKGIGVEGMWATFKLHVGLLERLFIPLKKSGNRNSRPWYKTKERKWCKEKRNAWKNYQTNPSERRLRIYKQARNKSNEICALAKRKFERRLAHRIPKNPKCFYSYVQSHTRLRRQVAHSMKSSEGEIVGDKEVAEHLRDYFVSVFRKDTNTNPTIDDLVVTSTMPNVNIRVEDTKKQLTRLCSSKSPGPDGIHPAMLQLIADEIAIPLTDMFNRSLEESVIPRDWKAATVVPIHKAHEANQAKNYRPVSLTSVPSKILERILRDSIADYLLTEGLLNPDQHGFVKGRSCLSNLLLALDKITDALDKGQHVQIGYLDFEKAFDSVNHRLLLQKMRAYNIAQNICDWTEVFLKDRTFSVKVREAVSSPAIPTSGVPQGTVLGPLLFLIYVNDLTVRLDSTCLLFADDVKVISTLSNGSQLQRDLNTINAWSKKWDLPLNPAKCVTLTSNPLREDLTIDDQKLAESGTVKDLGIVLNNSFTPSAQCAEAASKARKILFLLKGAIKSRHQEVWIPLYCAYVRPHLEYCVQAWSPYLRKDMAVLESVQRMATRWVYQFKDVPYPERLKRLGLYSLERRRLRGDLIEVYKILSGSDDAPLRKLITKREGRELRGHSQTLKKTRCNHLIRSNFFSQRVINPWNKLPEEVVTAQSLSVFKAKLDGCWEIYFPEIL